MIFGQEAAVEGERRKGLEAPRFLRGQVPAVFGDPIVPSPGVLLDLQGVDCPATANP